MATLIYSDVDGVDRSHALGREPVMVGRGPECAIRSQDPRVSRLHARFFVDQGALWVEDLGSSNGIFVGPNKVKRAPVPTGEIILVGSLMIRLLPASGTLPPPMGLHGTLATWLDLERKTRAAVEEERDAFAQRVGQLHQQIELMKTSPTVPPGTTMPQMPLIDAEAIRLRDEADARSTMLEQALKAVQDELDVLREVGRRTSRHGLRSGEPSSAELAELAELRDKVQGLERELKDRADWSSNFGVESAKLASEIQRLHNALDEAQSAQSTGEHAHGELAREAAALREQLDLLRRSSAAELEIAKLEVAKSRDAKIIAETSVGMVAAEKLAEADLIITGLERQVETLKAAQSGPDARAQQVADQIAALTTKAEKLEKELSGAQIRAQGAERNLSGANAQAAKAESRAAQVEQKLADAEERAKSAEHDVAKALERVTQLETRVGSGHAPVQAAEQRASNIAAELAEMTAQFETRRDRMIELETALAAAGTSSKAAEAKVAEARAETEKIATKLVAAEQRVNELRSKIDQLSTADTAIAAAAKVRDDAAAKVLDSDNRVRESERRAIDAEQRASAADTMAKAMAKDVAEALRRAADADTRAKSGHRELADAHRRAEEASAKAAESSTLIAAAQQRATDAEARAAKVELELTEKLDTSTKELTGKLDLATRELTTKLESTQRELAAERSGLLALVDRKTALEREVADLRVQQPVLQNRAETAEAKLAEAEAQIDTLQERVTDLESGLAVNETATQASRDEAQTKVAAAERKIAQLTEAAAHHAGVIDGLRARIAELEQQLRGAGEGRSVAEAAVEQARREIAHLVRAGDERAGASADEHEHLQSALGRASEAERKIDALTAKAEVADLAIDRAEALQRQLDEAMSTLSWLERDAASAKGRDAKSIEHSEAMVSERLSSAENRVNEAEQRAHEAEQQLSIAREEIADAFDRIKDAERRAAQGNPAADAKIAGLEQQLHGMQEMLASLQKEIDAAENVRSFAAETEREIAQFQRDLKDALANLTQLTLERDRLASELKDARNDDDTTSRALQQPHYDPEVTAEADLSKYEAMIDKSAELEDKLKKLEREAATLRAQLADAEHKLRQAADGGYEDSASEATHTRSQLPIALADHVGLLEEAIDSLRSNMRAASDETAMMDQTPSVATITEAISAAAEHIERARTALRALQSAIGL